MTLWTTTDINSALKINNTKTQIEVSGISIDTRTIKKGELFIPIEGQNYDGHDFIKEAFKNGASASLVNIKKRAIIDFQGNFIFVNNTMKSLSMLAEYSRRRIKNLITICITGSSGKTTLKEWIFETFKNEKASYCTFGNLNNQIGMPLTLVNMPKNTKLCILELGMNSPGEINKLSKIANPNISIITNIGSAHAGNFKNPRKKIVEEKSQIFNYLDKNSIAIIPRDSKYHKFMYLKAAKKTKKIFTFGINKDSNIKIIKNIKKKDSWTFTFWDELFKINNNKTFISWSQNVAVILCLAKILKVQMKRILPIIENLSPIKGRGELLKIKKKNHTFSLIDESYNSNPESLTQAIKNLKNYKSMKTRTICVIGDMLELGHMSEDFHKKMIKVLLDNEPDVTITLGNHSKIIFEKLPSNFSKFHFFDYKDVLNKLLNTIQNKDVIMIKGSNSTKLHLVSAELRRSI